MVASLPRDPTPRPASSALQEAVRVTMVSEADEPGSESGKRSDDRRGAARGMRAGCWSPQEGGASNHLTARLLPWASGSFVEAAMVAGEASYLACRLARASKHG